MTISYRRYVHALNAFVWAGIIALVAYWAWSPWPPTTTHKTVVTSQRNVPGGTFTVAIHATRHFSCPVNVSRRLYDGQNRQFRFEDYRLDTGGELGEVRYSVTRPIPAQAIPGRGRYEVVLAYHCNPVQRLFYPRIQVVNTPLTIHAQIERTD